MTTSLVLSSAPTLVGGTSRKSFMFGAQMKVIETIDELLYSWYNPAQYDNLHNLNAHTKKQTTKPRNTSTKTNKQINKQTNKQTQSNKPTDKIAGGEALSWFSCVYIFMQNVVSLIWQFSVCRAREAKLRWVDPVANARSCGIVFPGESRKSVWRVLQLTLVDQFEWRPHRHF